MSHRRAAPRAVSVPPPDVRGVEEERSSELRELRPGGEPPNTYPAAAADIAKRKHSTRTTRSRVSGGGDASDDKVVHRRRSHATTAGALRRTVLPSPLDFFIFHGAWAAIAVFWVIGVYTGQAAGQVGDPAFATTAIAIGYHVTLHVLCKYREWTELRKMWCYAATLGMTQLWTQYLLTEFDKPFIVPPPTMSKSAVTAPLAGPFPLRLLLWNIIPPFISVYLGFLCHKKLRSAALGYAGAAVTAALLILGALDLSPLVLRGALGEFRLVRYLPLPEPTFMFNVNWTAFLALPRPPYFDRVPAYLVLPSLAYGALAFEGYKTLKGMHKGAFGALAISLTVAMAHLGLSLSSYTAVEGFGVNREPALLHK